ncbi:polysaccharide deacetylase family protein [Geodermatophilus sp. SYSU D00684]
MTTARVAALTFDDGPDDRLTPAVLDVLDRAGVKATFFLVAERAREDPALARRVAGAGHDIGLHGDRHVDVRGGGLREQFRAVRRGRRDLERITGRPVVWFRPPYGKQDARTVLACRAAGMRCLLWSASALDWQDLPVSDQLARARAGLRPGAVVLLHDGAAQPVDPPAPVPAHQPRLTELLLDELAAQGLTAVPFSELRAVGRPVLEPWFGSWLHH